jgi:hypothetical protein
MKVGDLVKTGEDSVIWLVLKTSAADPAVLVESLRTGYRMWGNKLAFEVINENR